MSPTRTTPDNMHATDRQRGQRAPLRARREQADGVIDLDAWARQYVRAVLALEGWTVPADEIREAS